VSAEAAAPQAAAQPPEGREAGKLVERIFRARELSRAEADEESVVRAATGAGIAA
jgi:hypothetical protein